MKYREIIEQVRAFHPNEYTDDEMCRWMGDVNADIVRNVEKNAIAPRRSVNADDVVIVPAPYDDIYRYYILAQIAYYQKDYESYKVHYTMYKEKREGYMAYYIRTHGSDISSFKNWV